MMATKKDSYKKNIKLDVEDNLSENAVLITDSKAKLIYRDFLTKKIGAGLFSTSLGLFVSLITTLLTSTFNEAPGIDGFPLIMKGIYICLCFLFGVLTIVGFIIMIVGFVKYNEKKFISALHNNQEKEKQNE